VIRNATACLNTAPGGGEGAVFYKPTKSIQKDSFVISQYIEVGNPITTPTLPKEVSDAHVEMLETRGL
jgi:hypothetical protein